MNYQEDMGFPGDSVVGNLPANAGDIGDVDLIPGLQEPLEKEMSTYASFLAWKIQSNRKQKNLAGYSLWGHKELNTTEHARTHARRDIKETVALSHEDSERRWLSTSQGLLFVTMCELLIVVSSLVTEHRL